MNSSSHVLIDARWLGIGGVGRVTENLLVGLRELCPPGAWTIVGPAGHSSLAWPDAQWIDSRHPVEQTLAQRDVRLMRSVRADLALFVHQIRPLMRIAPLEITLIHDTIPIRYPTRGVPGWAFAAIFRRAARLSDAVATVSEYSARCIERDLGVDPAMISVVDQPIDAVAAARVRAMRANTIVGLDALYVGRDAPHKNLDRLVEAFGHTDLHRRGGTLVLAGIGTAAAARLHALAQRHRTRVATPGVVSQARLDELLAACSVLVQPSIEEGFGLPVAEALAAGVPVAASSAEALVEILDGRRPTFDPLDVHDMARAIDAAAVVGLAVTDAVVEWPTPVRLAASLLSVVDSVVGPDLVDSRST